METEVKKRWQLVCFVGVLCCVGGVDGVVAAVSRRWCLPWPRRFLFFLYESLLTLLCFDAKFPLPHTRAPRSPHPRAAPTPHAHAPHTPLARVSLAPARPPPPHTCTARQHTKKMTTAHRPTWAPAKGGDNEGGFKSYAPSSLVRAKDGNAGGVLKRRADLDLLGEPSSAAALRAELEARERKHLREQRAAEFDEEKEKDVLLLEGRSGGGGPTLVPNDADADDADDGGGGASASDSDDDDDDDSDDEAALLAELEKIKAERAAAAAAAAADQTAVADASVRDQVMGGNPLLAGGSGGGEFGVARAFGDDTVFRSTAARAPPSTPAKTFVNDTVRSEFHKRFMRRFFA